MRPPAAVLASLALLAVAVVAGLAIGREPYSLVDLVSPRDDAARDVILTLRLPRVVMGAIAGGGLAMVGVAFQAILRNPLAEPYVLGVSGGSALGATVAMVVGLTGTTLIGASIVPLAALGGGIAATLVVYALVRAGGRPSGTSILLAGIVVNAIASALITFLKTILTPWKAQELLAWLMGFLELPSWQQIGFVSAYVAVGGAIVLLDAGRLNVLALGNDAAEHLGIDVRKLEWRTFFACSAIVGAIVSVTGLIGFIGLIVPHATRRVVGPDVRLVLPTSFLAGGATLVFCDVASRLLARWIDTQPPVGAVTALLGGPIFLVLLRRRGMRA